MFHFKSLDRGGRRFRGERSERLQHGVVLSRGGSDFQNDLGQPGPRGRQLSREILTQVPAPSEEHRHYPYSRRAFMGEIERRIGEIGLPMLQKGEPHRHTLHSRRELVSEALERLGPARIARPVRVENHAESHGQL